MQAGYGTLLETFIHCYKRDELDRCFFVMNLKNVKNVINLITAYFKITTYLINNYNKKITCQNIQRHTQYLFTIALSYGGVKCIED